jgi:5' nucleotidase family
MHGTRMLTWSEIRQTYGRDLVNLRNEGRWQFLNTLFSVSEAVMYMQVRQSGCDHVACAMFIRHSAPQCVGSPN